MDPTARSAFLRYDWPGNVRELQNAVERAVVLGQDEQLELDDLPDEMIASGPADGYGGGYHGAVLESKSRILRGALAECNGCYVDAARQLGINVKYLHRLLKAHGLK